jgi:hypothetical protein
MACAPSHKRAPPAAAPFDPRAPQTPSPKQGQSQDGGPAPVTPSLSRRMLASSSDTLPHAGAVGSPPPHGPGLRTPSGWRAFAAMHTGSGRVGGGGGGGGCSPGAGAGAGLSTDSPGGSMEGGLLCGGSAAAAGDGSGSSGCAGARAGSDDSGGGGVAGGLPRGVLGLPVPLIDSPLAGAGPQDAAARAGSFSSASSPAAAASDCAALASCGRQPGGRVSAHGAFPVSFSSVPRPQEAPSTPNGGAGGGAPTVASCPSFDRGVLSCGGGGARGSGASLTSTGGPCAAALLAPLHDDPCLFHGLRVRLGPRGAGGLGAEPGGGPYLHPPPPPPSPPHPT